MYEKQRLALLLGWLARGIDVFAGHGTQIVPGLIKTILFLSCILYFIFANWFVEGARGGFTQ